VHKYFEKAREIAKKKSDSQFITQACNDYLTLIQMLEEALHMDTDDGYVREHIVDSIHQQLDVLMEEK
jgi:hypothetical protein